MRTICKTGSYGVMHLVVAVSVAFALTGDWVIALSIGLIEPLVQTLFYALHERVWERKRKGGAETTPRDATFAIAAAR